MTVGAGQDSSQSTPKATSYSRSSVAASRERTIRTGPSSVRTRRPGSAGSSLQAPSSTFVGGATNAATVARSHHFG